MNEKDQDRIEDYLYGRMSAEQATFFEGELEKNQTLAEAVELERLEKQALRLLSEEVLQTEMAAWKAEKEQTGASPAKIRSLPRRSFVYRLSAAAAVLLFISVPFWWANHHYNGLALANSALGMQTSLGDRSNIPSGSPLLPALELARTQNYEAAITELEKLQGTAYEEQAKLLMGEIYTERNNFAAATEIYASLTASSKDPIVQQKSEWLLSNVYLAANREAAALALLEKMAADNGHLKQQEAKSLLRQLNSIWRWLVF